MAALLWNEAYSVSQIDYASTLSYQFIRYI